MKKTLTAEAPGRQPPAGAGGQGDRAGEGALRRVRRRLGAAAGSGRADAEVLRVAARPHGEGAQRAGSRRSRSPCRWPRPARRTRTRSPAPSPRRRSSACAASWPGSTTPSSSSRRARRSRSSSARSGRSSSSSSSAWASVSSYLRATPREITGAQDPAAPLAAGLRQEEQARSRAYSHSIVAGGLRRDVVGDAVDAAHLVDDPARHLLQQRVRQLGPVGGHEVAGLHRAQRDHVLVGAAVAHHADALAPAGTRRRPARSARTRSCRSPGRWCCAAPR